MIAFIAHLKHIYSTFIAYLQYITVTGLMQNMCCNVLQMCSYSASAANMPMF